MTWLVGQCTDNIYIATNEKLANVLGYIFTINDKARTANDINNVRVKSLTSYRNRRISIFALQGDIRHSLSHFISINSILMTGIECSLLHAKELISYTNV